MEKWINVFESDSLISYDELKDIKKVCKACYTSGTEIVDSYNLKLLSAQGYDKADHELQIYTSREWRKFQLKELRNMKRVFLFMVDDSGRPKGFFKSFVKSYSKLNKPDKEKKNSEKTSVNSLEEIVRKVIQEMQKS